MGALVRSGRFVLKAYLDRADGEAHKMVLDHWHTAGELVLMVMEMMVAAKRLGCGRVG